MISLLSNRFILFHPLATFSVLKNVKYFEKKKRQIVTFGFKVLFLVIDFFKGISGDQFSLYILNIFSKNVVDNINIFFYQFSNHLVLFSFF